MTHLTDGTGALVSSPVPRIYEHAGPTLDIVTAPPDGSTVPGIVRGSLPVARSVALHAHADPETFYLLRGRCEALAYPGPDEPRWEPVGEGDAFHVPPGARHALRNIGAEPALALIISTPAMIRFFDRTGRPRPHHDITTAAAAPLPPRQLRCRHSPTIS